jgi:bifunctional non-homologous end joining protein LigD
MPDARFIEPMAALPVTTLPEGDGWLYEAKFDGYRALLVKNGSRAKIISRNGNDLTATYPSVRAAAEKLTAKSALIDGEIVAFDESGRPSFQALQHRTAKTTAIRYFAFDLLHIDGANLQTEPLTARRAALAKLIAKSELEFSDELRGTPEQIVEAIANVGLEGVVAKRRDSRYEPGRRSGAWQKFKVQHRQEFVVGGYKPENRTFQSLVVGYYEKRKLRFAGRVRAGLTPAQRTSIFAMLRPLKTDACPFADLPTGKTGHWGEGVTEEDMKALTWVTPTLVVEIAFTEWTRDGHLRHSAFVGLRSDKDARDVKRE